MRDDANLTAHERAILINRLKTASQAASEYEKRLAEKPFNEVELLVAHARAKGMDVDDVMERWVAAQNAKESMERSQQAYQGSWFTMFELKGLDPTDFQISYNEATEKLTVTRVKGMA
jgi:hypothetical protein